MFTCLLYEQDDVQLWLSHVAFCKKWVCKALRISFNTNIGVVSLHKHKLLLDFTHQATKGQISKVFSSMLAIHPDKPGTAHATSKHRSGIVQWSDLNSKELKWTFFTLALWIMAAKSELEDRNSSESARHLFLRALRFHPKNKKVYQEVKHHQVQLKDSSV